MPATTANVVASSRPSAPSSPIVLKMSTTIPLSVRIVFQAIVLTR